MLEGGELHVGEGVLVAKVPHKTTAVEHQVICS